MSKLKRKSKWDKPKLIVLTRGRPEENVLSACKSPDGEAGYPTCSVLTPLYSVSAS